MTTALILLVLAMPCAIAFAWYLHDKRKGSKLMPESLYIVKCSPEGVQCQDANGEKSEILWKELSEVRVRTNDTGPWGIDVLWGLHDEHGHPKVSIPGGATGESEMVKVFQRLPGFDNEEMIKAMQCTDNNTFLCWHGKVDAFPS